MQSALLPPFINLKFMIILLFFVLHWYASLFLQSFFYHRYTAHRHFTMPRKTEKFFHIASFLVHGSSYMSPFTYGIMHRLHHMHADTEEDPHSPVFHPGFWRTMWQTRNSYHAIHTGKTMFDKKLEKDLPRWDAFEKITHNWITRVCWIIVYVVFYMAFATVWCQYLLLPFTILMCTLQGAIVNWWAHKYGYVNYPMPNTSKNILPVDFLFMGDAYHNNHHKFPGRIKNAHRWFEVDAIYYVTWLLQKANVVQWKEK